MTSQSYMMVRRVERQLESLDLPEKLNLDFARGCTPSWSCQHPSNKSSNLINSQ